jgi:hypothetical protein
MWVCHSSLQGEDFIIIIAANNNTLVFPPSPENGRSTGIHIGLVNCNQYSSALQQKQTNNSIGQCGVSTSN